jgi:hypothetical protein
MSEINGLAVFCSRCWAPAGHHCRTSGNVNLAQPHRSRVKDAALAQSADELLDKILREARP